MQSCNNSRATSIELSHTASRRMQITLPENTTHIVICTSGRGNNNKPIGNALNNSVTLDINSGSGGDTCCNRSNLSGMKDCNCRNNVPGEYPIVNKSNIHVASSTNTSHMNYATNLIPNAAVCTENNVANKCNDNDEHPIDPLEADDSGNDGSKKAQYNCAECGKSYSTSSNLARHRQTHRYVS